MLAFTIASLVELNIRSFPEKLDILEEYEVNNHEIWMASHTNVFFLPMIMGAFRWR